MTTIGHKPSPTTKYTKLRLPDSTGNQIVDFARLQDRSGSRILDTGLSGTGAWIQSRDKNDYSVNYPLLLQPNGGGIVVGNSSSASETLRVYGGSVVVADSNTVNASTWINTNGAGRTFYFGPGVGASAVSDFGLYDATGTALRFKSSESTFTVNGSLFVSSAGFNWFTFGASSAGASYGVFRQGNSSAVLGYIGSDGGGALGGGTGDAFVIRAVSGDMYLYVDSGVIYSNSTFQTTGSLNAAKISVGDATSAIITSVGGFNTDSSFTAIATNSAVKLGIGYLASDNPAIQAFDTSNAARALDINPFGGIVRTGGDLAVTGVLSATGNVSATTGSELRAYRADNATYNAISYGAFNQFQFDQKNGGSYNFAISGTDYVTITAVTGLTVTGIISSSSQIYSTGPNTAHGASRVLMEQESSNLSVLTAYGQDTSTNGTLTIRLRRSDGSNSYGHTFSIDGLAVAGHISGTGNIQISGGSYIHSAGFGRYYSTPGLAVGQATYAGLYGPAITYNSKIVGGVWQSLGGGHATAITIDEGIFSVSTSQGVGAGDIPLVWTTGLTLSTDGNLAMAGAPRVWNSAYKAIQLGQSAFMARGDGADAYIMSNTYYSGSGWRYVSSTPSSLYSLSAGNHYWYGSTDGSPSVDGLITFVERLSLTSVGLNVADSLALGTSNSGGQINYFGDVGGYFEYVNRMGADKGYRWYTGASGSAIGMTLESAGKLITAGGIATNGNIDSGLTSGFNSTFRGLVFTQYGNSTEYGSVKMALNTGEVRHTAGFTGWGGYHTFHANGVNVLGISQFGLALNTTLTPWSAPYSSYQVGTQSITGSGTQSLQAFNAVYDSSWKYIQDGYANYMQVTAGEISWFSAPSGTAGAAASFTKKMSLDHDGHLSLLGNETYVNLNSSYSIGNNIRARFRTVGAGGGSGYGGEFRLSTRAPNNVWNDDALVVDSTGQLILDKGIHVRGYKETHQGVYFTVPIGGLFVFNLESLCGLYTSGIIYVRGNENGLNQTYAAYSYNLAYYVDGTRYVRITQLWRNSINNGYGDVYAYLSNYSGSYTTADQSHSGTGSDVSDIYLRNAVDQACGASAYVHSHI